MTTVFEQCANFKENLIVNMNKFVILCLIGFTLAQWTAARVVRDVSLGYHYHPGHSSAGSGFLQPPVVNSGSSYGPTPSGNSYYNTAPSFGSVGTSGFVPSTQTAFLGNSGSSFGGGLGGSGLSFASGGGNSQSYAPTSSQVNYDQQAHYAHQQQAPIITKHFYIHSAPEDHDEQQIVRYINIGRPQKNYRVVFINAPTSSVSKAKIIANVAPVEEKTAIYVLAKKSNALDVTAEVVTPPSVQNKPEVFFVKYKTPAEAEHAQHVIQAQYDALGGTSQVSNEGLVPVSSVIGSLGGSDTTATTGHDSGSIGVGNVAVTGEISGGTGCCGFNIDQAQNIGPAINVVTTGDNTQQTYLPPHH